ncbi:hypothetical protein L9F63_007943, partial [Diploptera punctata]
DFANTSRPILFSSSHGQIASQISFKGSHIVTEVFVLVTFHFKSHFSSIKFTLHNFLRNLKFSNSFGIVVNVSDIYFFFLSSTDVMSFLGSFLLLLLNEEENRHNTGQREATDDGDIALKLQSRRIKNMMSGCLLEHHKIGREAKLLKQMNTTVFEIAISWKHESYEVTLYTT